MIQNFLSKHTDPVHTLNESHIAGDFDQARIQNGQHVPSLSGISLMLRQTTPKGVSWVYSRPRLMESPNMGTIRHAISAAGNTFLQNGTGSHGAMPHIYRFTVHGAFDPSSFVLFTQNDLSLYPLEHMNGSFKDCVSVPAPDTRQDTQTYYGIVWLCRGHATESGKLIGFANCAHIFKDEPVFQPNK